MKKLSNERQSRLILCVNCNQWKVSSGNIEQGNCTFSDVDGEESSSIPTNYDTRCLLGLVEYN